MRVDRLTLTSFRSYESLDVSFPTGPQVVVGQNATGKTNLLESIVVLGTSRSHRASNDGELLSWGADFARLGAALGGTADGRADNRVEVVIERSGTGGGRKRVLVNGVARRPTALAAALPVVLFAPEDMLLVVGSPGGRRNSLDALVVQTVPAAGATMSNYGRALTQRNNLLRAIREGSAAPDELRYWDGVVIDDGAQIVDWRRAAIEQLCGPLSDAHREIAPAEEPVALRYLTNAAPLDGEATRDALRRRLSDTSEKELWNGATLIGPHRDDVAFVSGERELSTFASRGQQRRLAQIELLGNHPVSGAHDERRRLHGEQL